MKKQKDISKEEYIAEFCRDKRIRDRRVIYVSDSVFHNVKRAVRILSGNYITTSSYVDRILEHHFATYAQLINQLEEEETREFMGWGKKRQEEDESDD